MTDGTAGVIGRIQGRSPRSEHILRALCIPTVLLQSQVLCPRPGRTAHVFHHREVWRQRASAHRRCSSLTATGSLQVPPHWAPLVPLILSTKIPLIQFTLRPSYFGVSQAW